MAKLFAGRSLFPANGVVARLTASSRVVCTKEGGILMLHLPREEGQGLVEYALILLFIAIVVVAIMLIFGPTVGNLYSTVVNNWPFP
jgi:pilus assembly protein Flp/PilA